VRNFLTNKFANNLQMKRFLLLLAGFFLGVSASHGTTVIPPTFDELVSRAEVIFQGSVTNVRSQWVGEGAQRHIVTYVTFKVEEALKGNPGSSYVMRLLGGTVEDQTMEVIDGPKFQVGSRDIVFVEQNGKQFIPLVGIMHGRFRLEKDQAGREVIVTNARKPLTDVTRLGKEEQVSAPIEKAALSPTQFKGAIRANLQQAAARQP
jgi:hypothetical protein